MISSNLLSFVVGDVIDGRVLFVEGVRVVKMLLIARGRRASTCGKNATHHKRSGNQSLSL